MCLWVGRHEAIAARRGVSAARRGTERAAAVVVAASTRNAAAGSQPRRPQTWPRHMYWHQQGSEWVPAMYVEWYKWDRASDQSAGDVAVKWCANQTRTAFISNIPPIALPKWGNWLTPSVDGTITLPNEVHHFIRRLNLLRFQFRSQVY